MGEEENKEIKNKKLRKISKKINKIKEKNNKEFKRSLEKKIKKLEKKKERLEKWLKVKLPFRALIKLSIAWLMIGIICYGCSYLPILKEVKTVTMATVAYVAPEPLSKVLDIVTLNIGAKNEDFEWLKSTIKAYLYEEIKLETERISEDSETGYIYNGEKYVYMVKGREVTEEEYNKYIEEENEKIENITKEVFGTDSPAEINSMTIPEVLMKVATNSTPELISQLLDMSNLTQSSKNRLETDINKALKIIPKLNNKQMNELIDMTIDVIWGINEASQDKLNQINKEIQGNEIKEFNKNFEKYNGAQNGATVKQLINQVKVSNANTKYEIKTNIEESEIVIEEIYTVNLQYGNDGTINEINVK